MRQIVITKKAAELKLTDQIRLFEDPYGWATVREITEEEVILTRPYIATADFSYTGGVMTYIGLEEVKLWLGSDRVFEVSTESLKVLK